MTLDEFRQSLTKTEPPAGLTDTLAGLWWDAKGDWIRAHDSAQHDEGIEGSWVHAYLHRKEGDQSNAAYWYNRAGKAVSRESLDVEWLGIVRALLGWPTTEPLLLSSYTHPIPLRAPRKAKQLSCPVQGFCSRLNNKQAKDASIYANPVASRSSP